MGVFDYAGSSVFGESGTVLEADLNKDDMQELIESFYYDDLSRLPKEKIQEFTAPGGEGEVLVEAGVIGKRTLVRLSKVDDLERRIHMAALQMAKSNNDPLYDQLAKNRVKEKQLLEKIKTKYASKATKSAKIAQRQYIRTAPSIFSKIGVSLPH